MSEILSKKTSAKNLNQIEASSRIDSKAKLIEPIDFSFRDLMLFEGKFCKLKKKGFNFN